MTDCIGSITVSQHGIAVSVKDKHETSCVRYTNVTVENLEDAARTLAAWMDISYADLKRECQRIHDQDQATANLREIYNHFFGNST